MNTLQKARSLGKKFALGAAALGTSATVFAADHSVAIGAAGTDGATNTGAAVTAVLTIVAVVVGLGIVIAVMRRI